MAEMGQTPPATAYKSFSVIGKTFETAKVRRFISRASKSGSRRDHAGLQIVRGGSDDSSPSASAPPIVSIVLFAAFLGIWHLATRSTAASPT